MINSKYLKLIRSKYIETSNNFIYNKLAERIIDSIDLLKIEVNQILEIGSNDNIIIDYMQNKFKKIHIDSGEVFIPKNDINKKVNYFEIDINNLRLKKNFYNLIYSNCFFYITDNIEKNLNEIFDSLKVNGFFIAVIPDKNSMYQLINSMYETDLLFYKGVNQRFNPTFDINYILTTLNKLKFDSPSIYSDTISIRYSKFSKLLNDVRSLKLSYCHKDKKSHFENKNYFNIVESNYKKKYFNGSYILDLKVNIISAWKNN